MSNLLHIPQEHQSRIALGQKAYPAPINLMLS
jgi:hypothetical protein